MKLKKPRFWDQKKPNLYAFLFYPLAIFIQLLNSLKNKVPKNNFKIKTICLGNIYIGGTGKTSLAIELKKILDERKIKSCFIKKFYPDQFDEQNLLEKFGKVFLNKSRLKALQHAELENYDVAIFDDGLQDKTILYDISFACFNKKNFIGNGFLIPAGPLRESLENLNKYKNVFFIGNYENTDLMIESLSKKGNKLNFFEAEYTPLNINNFDLKSPYIVFSGIGNHGTFVDMLYQYKFNIIQDLEFPDHYRYSINDIEKIINIAKKNDAKILTTEKDFLRLESIYQEKIEFMKIHLRIKDIKKVKEELNIINEKF